MPTPRTSGNPAKKAAAKKPPSKRAPSQKAPTTSVNTTGGGAVAAFKNIAGGAVTLPSGVTVKMRTPGMSAFVTSGIIPNSLLPLIEEAMKGGSDFNVSEDEVKDRLGVDGVNDMMTMIDNVTMHCMVEPKCHPIPLNDGGEPDEDQRDDSLLYIDEVPFDDKIFIYQFAVGGTRDVERFRAELADSLGSVPDGQKQLRKAQRAPRRR